MKLRVHLLRLSMSNAFLVEDEHGLALVDAGSPGDQRRILPLVQQLGKPLRLIFITHAHFDHYGSARAVQAHTGAPLAIHAHDAGAMARGDTPIGSAHGRGRLSLPFLPLLGLLRKRLQTSADLTLQDGDRLDAWGVHARLMYTPGHTCGSSCLVFDDDAGEAEIAFAGDLVTAGSRPALQQLYAEDWDALRASLRRLQALGPGLVYAGHGRKPIRREELEQIRA